MSTGKLTADRSKKTPQKEVSLRFFRCDSLNRHTEIKEFKTQCLWKKCILSRPLFFSSTHFLRPWMKLILKGKFASSSVTNGLRACETKRVGNKTCDPHFSVTVDLLDEIREFSSPSGNSAKLRSRLLSERSTVAEKFRLVRLVLSISH